MTQSKFRDLMLEAGWNGDWEEFNGKPFCEVMKGSKRINLHSTFFAFNTEAVYLSIHYDRILDFSYADSDGVVYLILRDGSGIHIE